MILLLHNHILDIILYHILSCIIRYNPIAHDINIYIYISCSITRRVEALEVVGALQLASRRQAVIRDKDLYSTTNKCLQCLLNIMYTVFPASVRPFFILIIVRPRIFESKFRNHCAKKLVGALRKPTSLM